MAAHARYGTWVLIDGDEEHKEQNGQQSIATPSAVRPHIVHMNGRSFLPPEIKQKVEARFRMMQQQAGGHDVMLDGVEPMTPVASQSRRQRLHLDRHDERERLRETLRAELGLK